MRFLLTAWPLRAALCAGHALRNAATRFAAPTDRSANTQRTDDAGADPEGDEAARAKQKSEYLKLFAPRVSEIDAISLYGSAQLKTLPLLGRADEVIE